MGAGVLNAARPLVRKGGVLHWGRHSIEALVERHDTPLYIYDGDRVLERLRTVRAAFAGVGPLVAYSVKANANLALLRLLAGAGCGADIVSGGELHRVRKAGFPADRVVFAGVGKSAAEMREGLQAGIRAFHVESAGELEALGGVAGGEGRSAPVAVRVNPDVEAETHEFTRTGHAAAKFGVAPGEAVALYRRIAAHPHLHAVGIDVHIGSQVRRAEPFLRALDVVLGVARAAERESGARIGYLDLGGGFGIAGPTAAELDLAALGRVVAARLQNHGLSLIVEPGRFLVGDAGALATRVLYVKRSGGATFVVADAGMTELIRPSHYGGRHEIVPVRNAGHGPVARVDVVGPVCEQGDFLARDRELPLPQPGALLCVLQAGAYGFAMASNYNSRLRPAEVLLLGERADLVRRREQYADLTRNECP